MYICVCQCICCVVCIVGLIKQWAKSYFGSIELDPRKELESIPKHSTFFIIAPDNRYIMYDGIV